MWMASEGRRSQTLDSSAYETEFDVRKAMESQMSALNDGTLRGRMDATFGDLIASVVSSK